MWMRWVWLGHIHKFYVILWYWSFQGRLQACGPWSALDSNFSEIGTHLWMRSRQTHCLLSMLCKCCTNTVQVMYECCRSTLQLLCNCCVNSMQSHCNCYSRRFVAFRHQISTKKNLKTLEKKQSVEAWAEQSKLFMVFGPSTLHLTSPGIWVIIHDFMICIGIDRFRILSFKSEWLNMQAIMQGHPSK